MSGPYDDIINLPRHISATRPRMSTPNRAAQFSPFAALTSYNAAIKESSRFTGEKIELSESMIEELNTKLHMLADIITKLPQVSVTYFQPDIKKTGGIYVTTKGRLKKIDAYEHVLMLMNGEKIKFRDILAIKCKQFEELV